jgi:hypothetical protein
MQITDEQVFKLLMDLTNKVSDMCPKVDQILEQHRACNVEQHEVRIKALEDNQTSKAAITLSTKNLVFAALLSIAGSLVLNWITDLWKGGV